MTQEIAFDLRPQTAEQAPTLEGMGLFELLPIAQRLWPVPVGLLVTAACILAPRPTAALIEREAETKGREIAAVLDHLALSGLNHRHGSHPVPLRKR